ncbi:MAG TPA: SCO family protein [Chthoniobacteraceae bacterium]|jgi:protein SCO1/2|nr:SCO family protein [Chthoniobacteraceae bacterium]
MLRPVLSSRLAGLLLGAVLVTAMPGCNRARPIPAPSGDAILTYEVRGILREAPPGQRRARISHEAIPGYMEAMTMEFDVAEPAALAEFHPGDALGFRLSVTDKRGWIDRLRKLDERPNVPSAPETAAAPAALPDRLPDCELIDETGRRFHLSDYAGRPLAITFIFTRCPFPDFCPRMNERFAEARFIAGVQLKEKDWRFVSVTIDPEYDTSERLAEYAARYGERHEGWIFATGQRQDIRALGAAVGLVVSAGPGLPEHNLRTVVIDPGGRVKKIFSGNNWTTDELVSELHELSLR